MSFFRLSCMAIAGRLNKKSFHADDAMSSTFTQTPGEIRKNVGMLSTSGHRSCWRIKIGLECSG